MHTISDMNFFDLILGRRYRVVWRWHCENCRPWWHADLTSGHILELKLTYLFAQKTFTLAEWKNFDQRLIGTWTAALEQATAHISDHYSVALGKTFIAVYWGWTISETVPSLKKGLYVYSRFSVLPLKDSNLQEASKVCLSLRLDLGYETEIFSVTCLGCKL
jgi:hypothetical protein